MPLTYPQRGFAGAAVAGTIASPGLTAIDGAGVTFTSSTTLTGWTEIANGSWSGDNICVTFGYGTSSEEKILCTFNSSTSTFTIVARGYDGTSAVAHTTGSLFINTFTATEAAELNAVTQSMKGLLLTDGSAPLPADISTSAAARGSSTKPAAANHTHLLSTSTLNGWLTGSASGQLPSAVSVYLSSLAAGALPTTIATSQVWTQFGGTTSGGVTQNGITGFTKYIVVAFSRVTTTASGVAAQIQISITANGVSSINPMLQTVPNQCNASLVTFAYVQTTAGTTFSAQNVPNYGSSGGVSSSNHNLIVIGLN
jgi:hypothetical protein